MIQYIFTYLEWEEQGDESDVLVLSTESDDPEQGMSCNAEFTTLGRTFFHLSAQINDNLLMSLIRYFSRIRAA
jgi:hypothetical protein